MKDIMKNILQPLYLYMEKFQLYIAYRSRIFTYLSF